MPDPIEAESVEDEAADDHLDDSLYLKYLFEGAETLADLSAALRAVADDLDQKARAGWRLAEPVEGGWAHLVVGPA